MIKINGKNVKITKPALIAAAHRQGAGKANSCLNLLEKNGDESYIMNLQKLKTTDDQQKCKTILTRIRDFEKY